MKVVILAGGFGTRISEESVVKPKPMVEIGEQPILWHIMKEYFHYGFDEFIICAGYKQHIIKEYFHNYDLYRSDITFDFSGNHSRIIHNNFAEPWKVTVVDTGRLTMTGGRIRRIKEHLGNEPFMLTYGDGVADLNIRELAGYHKSHGKMVTMSTYNSGQRFGVLDVDKDGTILEFREKTVGDSNIINIGYMVCNPEFVRTFQDAKPLQCDRWVSHCAGMRERFPVVLDTYRNADPLNAYYFTSILSELTPEDAVVLVDTGSVSNVVSQTWHVKKNQKYFISGGLSCMGFWAGAAGCLDQPVTAIAGDGSTSMNIQEFATLAYYRFPVKLFVYNNNGYMLIRHNQHNYMNDRFLGVGPDSGVGTPDFMRIAQAYDLPAVKISYGDHLEEKIREVYAMDGPVVCEVMLEPFGPMAPRIASKVMPDGSLKAAEFDDLAPFLNDWEKPQISDGSSF